MKLIHIVGARPNFIKLWPVYEAAKKRDIEQVVVHTGQHYDYEMSEMFFEELSLPKPDVNLNVGSGSHAWQTGLIMLKLEDYLKEEDRRAVVVVYGDVNSTLAAAVTAAKLNFKIAHVEAGIRSWDNTMPEEINRKVVDEISDYRFCPSEVARRNINGSWLGERALNVGDVTYDAFLWAQDKLGPPKSTKDLRNDHILVTIHRERNTEPETFRQIEDAITNIGE
jgi:UDP-N-acetylglucosamine 2-epimerase (non-hydrolysing)